MKKIIPAVFLCLLFLELKATTWNVTVENYQFSPANLNVVVGDIIHWQWGSGFHTTSSLTVPAGASPWDSQINSGSASFSYTVTTAGAYTYQCNIHPTLMMGSFTASVVLPVTLSTFEIENENGQAVLNWTTSTEINADYFSIRRSFNGTDFNEIAKVTAAGNSVIEKKYSFSDGTIPASVQYAYYALATVDKDGKMQLSPIKVYRNKGASVKLITLLSPNPISGMGHLMLQFNADKTGLMKVKIADMQGRIILKTELAAAPGINNGHIHLGDIPPGVYTIYFSLDGTNESRRITKE